MNKINLQFVIREHEITLNNELDGKIERLRAKVASLLGFKGLFTAFCAVCLVNEYEDCHKIKDTAEGPVYRLVEKNEILNVHEGLNNDNMRKKVVKIEVSVNRW